MGIYKRQSKGRPPCWYVQYSAPGPNGNKRWTERAGTSRSSAVKLLGQRLEELSRGMWEPPQIRQARAELDAAKRRSLAFRTLADDYQRECLDRYVRKREVVASMEHLVTFFGNRQVDTISRMMVEHYKKDRLAGKGIFAQHKPVGARTVNIELSYARKLVNWAIYEVDLPLSRNVFARFRRLNEAVSRRKAKPPTPEEFGRLLAVAEDRLLPVLLTGWYTGMRHAEVANLRKSNVNLPWDRIVLDRTKNGDSRQILIHSKLRPILERSILESPSDYVFPGRNGRPLNSRKMFEKAREAAGLPGLWFHDLRKAAVTYMRGAGHPDKTVAAIAGHRDMRVSDLYTVPTEAQMRAAVEAIPEPGADNVQTALPSPTRGPLTKDRKSLRISTSAGVAQR